MHTVNRYPRDVGFTLMLLVAMSPIRENVLDCVVLFSSECETGCYELLRTPNL
jgi:hypothetical protein